MGTKSVTAEQVRDTVLTAGITYIPHHRCGGCQSMVGYQILQGQLFFDPACGCTSYSRGSLPEPREWQNAAEWINMQTNEEIQNSIMKSFGFKVEDGEKQTDS